MGFKTTNQSTIEEALKRYLGLVDEDFELVDTEEEEGFTAAEVTGTSTSLIEKASSVLHLVLDQINAGDLVIENGEELLQTMQSVAVLESIKEDN